MEACIPITAVSMLVTEEHLVFYGRIQDTCRRPLIRHQVRVPNPIANGYETDAKGMSAVFPEDIDGFFLVPHTLSAIQQLQQAKLQGRANPEPWLALRGDRRSCGIVCISIDIGVEV